MAKGRMLNKTISIDKELAKLSKEAILLYIWCIPHLDIKGRIFAEPEQLKGTVIPYLTWFKKPMIIKAIKEIKKSGLVIYYGDTFKYMEFRGFSKNQTIYPDREAKSMIPDPSQDEIIQRSCNTHGEVEVEVKEKLKIKKKEREEKLPHMDFVFLKPSEHQKLLQMYGEKKVNEYIESLKLYIGKTNKNYPSHYYAILSWMRKDRIPKNIHRVTEEDHKKRRF